MLPNSFGGFSFEPNRCHISSEQVAGCLHSIGRLKRNLAKARSTWYDKIGVVTYLQQGAPAMAKSQDSRKETKKKPAKTAKEKRADKKAKKKG